MGSKTRHIRNQNKLKNKKVLNKIEQIKKQVEQPKPFIPLNRKEAK